MNDGKRRAALRSALLRRFGQRFAALLNILRDALQAPASDLRPGNYFLDVAEGIGIVGLLAKFLNEGMDLGENEEHFAATARLQKEFFIERAVEHERRSHIPIAAHLSNPCALLAGQRTRNLYQLIGALRPEFRRKPVPRFAHFRLAAEIVEFQNQSGIVRGSFFCHVFASLVMFQKFCFEQPYLSDLISYCQTLFVRPWKRLLPRLRGRARNRILYWDTRSPIRLCAGAPPDTHARNPDISRQWAWSRM